MLVFMVDFSALSAVIAFFSAVIGRNAREYLSTKNKSVGQIESSIPRQTKVPLLGIEPKPQPPQGRALSAELQGCFNTYWIVKAGRQGFEPWVEF